MNETETRAALIDPALKAAGWGVVASSQIRMEYPITKGRLIGHGQREKPKKADYVLQYHHINLAIIEAKRVDLHYTEGVAQAKNYGAMLKTPFAYSTNGSKIYEMNLQTGKEYDILTFPTPEMLWKMVFGDAAMPKIAQPTVTETLRAIPFETRGGLWMPRYYQEQAVQKVIESIGNQQHRILLTLATGTGKTAIAFQIAWKLFHAKWNLQRDGLRNPRILFLADRNILANQAFNAFSAFDEDALKRIRPEDIRKKGKVPKNGNVFFTIFQTFMSGANDTPYFGEYDADFFDCIIIDECHRGGAKDESTWRTILEYFAPAVQLGLTATPKRNQNVDTYQYFGAPVYEYSLKAGINDGFLTPFKVKQIATTGDDYIYTSDDEILEGAIDEGKIYSIETQNRIIELMDIEAYRVQKFMEMMDQSQKTLVFCATQAHALAVRNLINQMAKNKHPNYCHRVTADDGKLGEQHLSDFQDNEKQLPTVLTTSQKLSTGVDAPEVKNIVLLRPVTQLIEFKQIIGRGTRLYDGKDYFTIYDFVKAYRNFKDPDWDGEPSEPEITDSKSYQNTDTTPVAQEPESPRQLIRVKLSDGKIRELQSMVSTSFWSPDGKPISAPEFLENLFGTLPELFKSEQDLKILWSKPNTRKKLLAALSEKGFAETQLQTFQKALCAENSDLYDILAYIAFHAAMLERTTRATQARLHLNRYTVEEQVFLDFVLNQYVELGVSELDENKLTPLLLLKYDVLTEAKRALGNIKIIRSLFVGFQAHLYQQAEGW
jgi:type I restriction enzyme R subunit